jgi:hypothetical protein
MNTYTTPLIKEAAKSAFSSAELSEVNFVVVVDMGMNDFTVIDYDNNFDALIPTVADIYDPVYIVDRNLIVSEFS